MNHETIAAYIADGKAVLGIEFGSTRIKAVLIGNDHAPIASGDHTWENRLEGGIWTYHLDDVWAGVQDAFANLQKDVQANYGVTLTNLAAFGVSGMMHGFLAFDENGRQLAQFRTWRNTMTAQAAEKPIAARQESVNVVILVSIVFCTFMSAVRSRRPAGSLY